MNNVALRAATLCVACLLPHLSGRALSAGALAPRAAAPRIPASAQETFESVVEELKSSDRTVRLRAVRLLRDASYPEAAEPLAPLITDSDDEVQLEAIAAELNLFVTGNIVTRRRVGLVVEVRNRIAAAAAFSQGPLAIGARPVPAAVLTALRQSVRDGNSRVALESLYAFGTLAVEPSGARRRAVLRESARDLADLASSTTGELRYGVVRVIGRVFERRPADEPADPAVGDALVGALNDSDRGIRVAAMQALGALRAERAVAALTEQLQFAGQGESAEAALGALARIAHPSSAALFASELEAKHDALKALAVEGLARLGDRTRSADIDRAMAGAHDDRVLMAGQFAAVLLADASPDPLVESLRKPKLAGAARQYLTELSRGRSSLLSRQARDPDPVIRAGVADVLGLGGDLGALAIVEAMQSDRDQQVVLEAQRAVARLNALRQVQ